MSHFRPNLTAHDRHLQSEASIGLPSPRWRLAFNTLVATLRLWRHRRAQRRELARLDRRTLQDIGIAPGMAEYEAGQPFWRSLRDDWRG